MAMASSAVMSQISNVNVRSMSLTSKFKNKARGSRKSRKALNEQASPSPNWSWNNHVKMNNSISQVSCWNNWSSRATNSSSAAAELEKEKEEQVDIEKLTVFLEADLPHLFDEQGIDKQMYDKKVEFRDPITKYDSIEGYLFNIQLLRLLFRPSFQLHNVKQTGPNEITTRWTMVMTFGLLPWKPQLVFTGTSVMGVNPETGKFCSHADYWDSIKKNDYFSLEGFMDVLKQLRIYKTPDLETPKYQILKRTADYEVRKYEPFIVIETKSDKLTGSSGFNKITGYIFGKNTQEEKIPMTTPVFTQTTDELSEEVWIQIFLPLERQISELPAPLLEDSKLRKIQGNIAAATKFSGKATEEIVFEKEKNMRAALVRDGIQLKPGCMLARYNDPNRTWSFLMRNEVLIWLDTFFLE